MSAFSLKSLHIKRKTLDNKDDEQHMSAMQLENRQSPKLPFAKSFAGHQTFAFRYSWLKKGLDLVRSDSGSFQRDDAVVQLGVGKNMVESIRHWCLATQILEEESGTRARDLRPTELGSSLLSDNGWDPYLVYRFIKT